MCLQYMMLYSTRTKKKKHEENKGKRKRLETVRPGVYTNAQSGGFNFENLTVQATRIAMNSRGANNGNNR